MQKDNKLFAGLSIGTTKTVMITAEKVPDCKRMRRAFTGLTGITGINPARPKNVTVSFNETARETLPHDGKTFPVHLFPAAYKLRNAPAGKKSPESIVLSDGVLLVDGAAQPKSFELAGIDASFVSGAGFFRCLAADESDVFMLCRGKNLHE